MYLHYNLGKKDNLLHLRNGMTERNNLFQIHHFLHEKSEVLKATQLFQVTWPVMVGQDPKAPAWTLSPATVEKVKEGRDMCQNKANFPTSFLGLLHTSY